ncbi:MraY family glycosyltransferase [Methanocaldococcus indicus]|uniref:MraY family glycosyltransferase n=1 Tax=Methanocaldococcus indicus TaxID=213231 RepID=UPI003C6DAD1C
MDKLIYFPLLGFLLSLILTKIIIKKIKKFGYDIHKLERYKVPEMGGLAVLLSSCLVFPYINLEFLVPILSTGIVGVIDDLSNLSPKEKLILLFLVGFFFGLTFNVYFAIGLGIMFMVFSNLTNMLAGFNGLEVGLGVLSSLFLGIILLLDNQYIGFIACLTFSFIYLGLLFYNRYPAKIFPGDCGTLPIGAFLSFISLYYNEIIPFFIIMAPYIIDASLKYLSAGVMSRDEHKPTTIREDGKLYYISGYLSLPRLILKIKPMKEYYLVSVILLIEVLFGILAIVFKEIVWTFLT